MSASRTTLDGLKRHYAHRTVFCRGEAPSALQLAQAIGELDTMVGQMIRLLEERERELADPANSPK